MFMLCYMFSAKGHEFKTQTGHEKYFLKFDHAQTEYMSAYNNYNHVSVDNMPGYTRELRAYYALKQLQIILQPQNT